MNSFQKITRGDYTRYPPPLLPGGSHHLQSRPRRARPPPLPPLPPRRRHPPLRPPRPHPAGSKQVFGADQQARKSAMHFLFMTLTGHQLESAALHNNINGAPAGQRCIA